MKIEIKKINSQGKNQKENIIKQIEEIISDSKKSLKSEAIAEKISYTNWKENILAKSSWEEAKDYGNQILALILVQQELAMTEEAIKSKEEEMVIEQIDRLEEILATNDTDLQMVLNGERDNYIQQVNKLLSELVELEEEMNQLVEEDEQVESNQWVVDEEKRKIFLNEIKSLCQEKGVEDWQINDKLMIKLKSSGVSDYREFVKKKVYSQTNLEKWRNLLNKIIQQVFLEKKREEVMRNKPFDFAKFKTIQEELAQLNYRDIYSEIEGRGYSSEETSLKKTIASKKEEVETEEKFKEEFGVREGIIGKGKLVKQKPKAKRTFLSQDKKPKTKEADKEIVKAWFDFYKELNQAQKDEKNELHKLAKKLELDAEKSRSFWENGWNPPNLEKNLKRKDLPYNEKRANLGAWIREFEKVEEDKEIIITTEEILKWWEKREITKLNPEKSAEACGNGWSYEGIENGFGSLAPNSEGTFNIPVNQTKTLGQEKEEVKLKLANFFFAVSVSDERKNSLKPVYKKGINEASTSEEVQNLLKKYMKEFAIDQIQFALTNSTTFLLQKDNLLPESQNIVDKLTNEDDGGDIDSIAKMRDKVLVDIKETRKLLESKNKIRKLFGEEIINRIELAVENKWEVKLDSIDEKDWVDYLKELDIQGNDKEVYQKISENLLTKLQEQIRERDNEGKSWEPILSSEKWKELEKNFDYDQIDEEVKIINVKSVVEVVKKLAINRWKDKIEQKIKLAKSTESGEKSDGEISDLIDELDSIASWDLMFEGDGDSNQKKALEEKKEEFYGFLEAFKYEFYLSIIKKVQDLSKIDTVKEKIRKIKEEYLSKGKKRNDLYQAFDEQEALISLEKIVREPIPTETDEIVARLVKLRVQSTSAQKKAYVKLNQLDKAVDKKVLGLKKELHLKVDSQRKKWEYDLTEEQKSLIKDSSSESDLQKNLWKIEESFQFRTNFYRVTKIEVAPENNQLIDKYWKLELGKGEAVGLIYQGGWENPAAINEYGFASLDGGQDDYPYDVKVMSKLQAQLQAQAMSELQEKIDKAKEAIKINSEERLTWLKTLSSLDKWAWEGEIENEEIEDDLAREAWGKAIEWKKNDLIQTLKDLSSVEAQSISSDLGDENKYNKDPEKLEELIGDRIACLYDNGSRNRLNELKEKTKKNLEFRSDFLKVIGNEEEKPSDELIENYRKKGFEEGGKAGQIYSNGWKDPTEFDSQGQVYLKRKTRLYRFVVDDITRKQAEEEIVADEVLRELIYKTNLTNDLTELEVQLNNLESLIPQDNSDPNNNKPLRGESILTMAQKSAYQRNESAVKLKQGGLVKRVDNLRRKELISEINSSLQKINDSIRSVNPTEKLIQDDLSMEKVYWEKKINDQKVSLEKVKNGIATQLTKGIRAALISRLKELCEIRPEIEFSRLGISSFDIHFPVRISLAELVEKSEKVTKKIAEVRGQEEKSAAGILDKLINKPESEDAAELLSDLSRLQDLIPSETKTLSLKGRNLTSVEVDAYKEREEEVEEKELSLLKKIFQSENQEKGLVFGEKERKLIARAEDKEELEAAKNQILYEVEIEEKLKEAEKALGTQGIKRGSLLHTIDTLESFESDEEEEEWKEQAWFSKRRKVGNLIKRLKMKIMECDFEELIEKIEEETELSELDNLLTEWEKRMWEERINNEEMPKGKRKEDLITALNERKKNLPQQKTLEEKLEEALSERDTELDKMNDLRQSLEKIGITLEGDNWNIILQVLNEKTALAENVEKAEKILGTSLNRLDNQLPSLVNYIEVASLLNVIGVDLEKDGETGRNHYNLSKLKRVLDELKEKQKENELWQEKIREERKKMEKLNEDLERTTLEKEKLEQIIYNAERSVENLKKDKEKISRELQAKEEELKEKKAEFEIQKKRAEELTAWLNNATNHKRELEAIVANNNTNWENESSLMKEKIELLRAKLVSELGEETEVQIETLLNSNYYKPK